MTIEFWANKIRDRIGERDLADHEKIETFAQGSTMLLDGRRRELFRQDFYISRQVQWSNRAQLYAVYGLTPSIEAAPGATVGLSRVGVTNHVGKEAQEPFSALFTRGQYHRLNRLPVEFTCW